MSHYLMNARHVLLASIALGSLAATTACARQSDVTALNTPAPKAVTAEATPAVVATALQTPDAASNPQAMIVHSSASCGCCTLWVDHMRKAGFAVEVRNTNELQPIKERVGVPVGKASCHTAEIGGYFIEGHVPAEDVKRLLAERPAGKGLVLPGMPLGSPGMEVPDGTVQPYTVELVDRKGTTTAFARH